MPPNRSSNFMSAFTTAHTYVPSAKVGNLGFPRRLQLSLFLTIPTL